MNTTHFLSDLAEDLADQLRTGGSKKINSFELPESSSAFMEGFFNWIVYLFGHNKNTVTVIVTDNLPTVFFCMENCAIRFSPDPEPEYRSLVYKVACIFDKHPHFKVRIGEKTVTFQFNPN